MTNTQIDVDTLKRRAGEAAAEDVKPGMIVGLGHGSTAIHAVRRIAERIRAGELPGVRGVACSSTVEKEAARLGISMTTLEEHPVVDLTIDGADEVDAELNCIKGGGGALLREKIVAQASRREIIIVDSSKLSQQLNKCMPLPVEVFPFALGSERLYLERLGAAVRLRENGDGTLFLTDQGNIILDCDFGGIMKPSWLAAQLDRRAGVAAHGLFIGLASEVIVGEEEGVRRIARPPRFQTPSPMAATYVAAGRVS